MSSSLWSNYNISFSIGSEMNEAPGYVIKYIFVFIRPGVIVYQIFFINFDI